MEPPKCETCAYWDAAENGMGECRRRAPLARDSWWAGYDAWAFVDTMRSDWCGEHPDFPAWIESRRHQKGADQ